MWSGSAIATRHHDSTLELYILETLGSNVDYPLDPVTVETDRVTAETAAAHAAARRLDEPYVSLRLPYGVVLAPPLTRRWRG